MGEYRSFKTFLILLLCMPWTGHARRGCTTCGTHSSPAPGFQSSNFSSRGGGHRYGSALRGEQLITLRDVLMVPEGGFQLRDKDGSNGGQGVFRYWRIEPNGQLSILRPGVGAVPAPADVAQQFREVVEQTGERPENFDAFLQWVAGQGGALSPAPESNEGTPGVPEAPGAPGIPGPLVQEAPELPSRREPLAPPQRHASPESAPQSLQPEVPAGTPQGDQRPPPETGRPVVPPAVVNTNPRIDITVFSRQKRTVQTRGPDGVTREEQVPDNRGCGSFLAHSENLGNGSCRNYLVTAAHCVPSSADPTGGHRDLVSKIEFDFPGQESQGFEDANAEIQVDLPDGNLDRDDFALISLKMPCRILEGRQAPICSYDERGVVDARIGNRLTLHTYNDFAYRTPGQEIPAHRHGQSLGTLRPRSNLGQWTVRTDIQSLSIAGGGGEPKDKGAAAAGDSGGPITLPSGCVGGVVSGITRLEDGEGEVFTLADGTTKQGTFIYTFSPKMAKWVEERMRSRVGQRFAIAPQGPGTPQRGPAAVEPEVQSAPGLGSLADNSGAHGPSGSQGPSGVNPERAPQRPAPEGDVSKLAAIMPTCIACHNANGVENTQAGILAALNSYDLPFLNEMLRRTQAKGHTATAEEKRILESFVAQQNPVSLPVATTPRVQLQRPFLLPQGDTNDAGGRRWQALSQMGLTYYSTEDSPRTFQDFKPGERQTYFHHPSSGDYRLRGQGYYDHGAQDWTWNQPAGTAAGMNVTSGKFFIPPPAGPMMEVFEVSTGHRNAPYSPLTSDAPVRVKSCQYQPGTTFGETLYVNSPSGQKIPFEQRLRTKQTDGTWKMDVLRPFANSAEVAARIKELRPNWASTPQLQSIVTALENDRPRTFTNGMSSFQRNLSSTARVALMDRALTAELPAMPEDLVRDLLTQTPFKSVFGVPWYKEGNNLGWAPLVSNGFGLFPTNYRGAFLPMTSSSCMNCHQDAGKHVDRVDPPAGVIPVAPGDSNTARTWYGWVPGCDGILSGMFVDPASINAPGRIGQRTPRFNPRLGNLIRERRSRR